MPEKYLLLLHWLCWSLWLCGSQQTVKILEEMGIPDHLTRLLRHLYMVQEATLRTGHGTTDWFKIGKGVQQDCILSICLFNVYAEYIMWNARLGEFLVAACGILFPGQGLNLGPLHWECGVLATAPPGKSSKFYICSFEKWKWNNMLHLFKKVCFRALGFVFIFSFRESKNLSCLVQLFSIVLGYAELGIYFI